MQLEARQAQIIPRIHDKMSDPEFLNLGFEITGASPEDFQDVDRAFLNTITAVMGYYEGARAPNNKKHFYYL